MDFGPLDQCALDDMARKMRPIDVAEFKAMSGGQGLGDCLSHLLDASEVSKAARFDGELVACFGVIRQTPLSLTGFPWLCATDAVGRPEVRRAFVQNTRPQMIEMSEGFSHLWNMVSVENTVAIRWLKWMRFDFEDHAININGVDFVKFSMGAR